MKAVAYIRVSDKDQVEGFSLDAQERHFNDYCKSRGWDPIGIYREEGRSAHVDTIEGRPEFQRLIDDSAGNTFEVVVVHTIDRWSRNLKVTLESLSILGNNDVGLVSITESLDYSTPHGRFTTQMLGSVAELYSGLLSTHTKKGIGERAMQGLHLGTVPFGYGQCWDTKKGERIQVCKPEHAGGVHPHKGEGPAVQEMFRQYATGTVTTSGIAKWLNEQGFVTRNKHQLPDGNGGETTSGRHFTVASVRGILHNPFFTGRVKHKEKVLPGAHEAIVSIDLFDTVQAAMKRNSGRSETLQSRPEREYLLKGIIHCAYCRMSMWAQTYRNGRRYYREQYGSRGAGYCVDRSGSVPCDLPDDQMGQIIGALVLPESWFDLLLARVHMADEVKRVERERKQVDQRLKRLGQVYVDGVLARDEYHRQKKLAEQQLRSLVVPEADVTRQAGELLEDLPRLWKKADLGERRQILLTMLDAAYLDTVEERTIVAIKPRPAFRPLFEIATMREDSGIYLINERDLENSNRPPAHEQVAEADSCFWWRRGRVELPVQKTP